MYLCVEEYRFVVVSPSYVQLCVAKVSVVDLETVDIEVSVYIGCR